MSFKETIGSLAIAVVLGFGLVACSGSSGDSAATSTTTTSTTSTSTTTVDGQSATTVAAVTGTGTTGTTSTSLTVADKISVVSSGSSTAPKGMHIIKSLNGLLGTKAVPSTWAATVDYNIDPTFTYVHERSAESLKTPNEILCMVSQAKYDDMLNKGAYRAQIDKNLCSSSKDSASQAKDTATSSSGSGAPDYMDWTVISNRIDASSPQVVSAWLHETMGGGGKNQSSKVVILTKTIIGESSSATNPYGLFTMNFAAYPENSDGTLGTTEVMHGYLRTVTLASGKVVLQFYDTRTEGTLTMEEATTLYKASDGTAGSGEAKFPDYDAMYGTGTAPAAVTYKQMRFAYDTASFKRSAVDSTGAATGTSVCLDKNSAHYLTSVWSYGLYDDAGKRKTLNSGFPVVYNDGTADYYGYVGFWGMWFPDSITLPNPATVNKLDWSGGASVKTALTAKKSAGKFTKHTRNTTTLDKIKNVALNYSQCTQSGSTYTCGNYEAHWDGTKFAITQKMGQSGYEALASTDPTFVDVSALQWQSTLNMWSQALGGQVMIKFPSAGCTKSGGWNQQTNSWTQETYNCTAAIASPSTVPIVYYQDTLFMPGDAAANLTLSCFSGCPKGSQFTATATGNAFYTEPKGMMTDTGLPQNDTKFYTIFAKSYTYSDTAYTLTDNTATTGGAVGLTTQNTSLTNEWGGTLDYGVQTGALFNPSAVVATTTATTADGTAGKTYAELLKCPWDTTAWGSGAQVCPWQAREALPVYYTWETGWNTWNYLTALYDSAGVPVKFDQPIRVSYTYPATATVINSAATDTKFASVPFQLEYNGFGQLWGIPGHCVDPDNGADTACGMNVRWIPEFSIPSGETASDGTNTYYIKALDQEQRMPELALASCTASLVTYTLPVNADYTKPDIGAEPAVAEPPAVIGGVVVKK